MEEKKFESIVQAWRECEKSDRNTSSIRLSMSEESPLKIKDEENTGGVGVAGAAAGGVAGSLPPPLLLNTDDDDATKPIFCHPAFKKDKHQEGSEGYSEEEKDGVKDKMDGVYVKDGRLKGREGRARAADPAPDKSNECLVDCIYYSMMCCECNIL